MYSSRSDTEINGGAGEIAQIVERLISLAAATVAIPTDLGDADIALGGWITGQLLKSDGGFSAP